MEHSPTALEIRKATGWNLDDYATDREWSGVGVGPVGRHRDSDALAESNWEVIVRDLTDRFGDDVNPVRFSHWACGWIQEIAYNLGNAELVAAVATWNDRLANYPVADDDHYCQTEWDENHPDADTCYAEDCPCGVRESD